MSMREVEPGVGLIMLNGKLGDKPSWAPRVVRPTDEESGTQVGAVDDDTTGTDTPAMHFTELVGRELKGETIEMALPGSSDRHRVRFLREGEGKPELNSSCVVYREGLKQPDAITGFAFGKVRWKTLQDAETGESIVSMTIRRPGATVSVSLKSDDWSTFSGFGIVETK
jgi:hypothetical protein